MAAGQTMRTRVDALARNLAAADTRPAGPPGGGDALIDERLRERLRVIACCLALTVLVTSTRPGRILADTKIDMAVNPSGFLGRALHLWDPEQFGQLQNQAVGYLFPMGPFYAAGDLIGLPPWITQRFWLAMLLCLAFLGTRRLARRLRIGGPVTQLIAGLVYALAPNGLATMGQISSEYLPFAMLPWIVLPLVTGVQRWSQGRRGVRTLAGATARSGVAVACCGGINAAATVAVLVVPVLYLLTRPRGVPRGRLMAWWSVAVAAATSWWLIPLLLTGTYGFSWLTYTEKAATTTGVTGLVNVLRGAERWVNYVAVDGQIWWPVGHALSAKALPVLCTGLLAALGLAGLLRARLPERTFLICTVLAGMAIISAGHMSGLEGPLGGPVRDLLDGPLAPIRNLHKFDAVVRLPLALGVAHLLASIPVARNRLRTVAVTFVALAGVAVTALSIGLSGPGDFHQVPKYWRDAASWLNKRAGDQAVLAVPGAAFGQYLWGRPMDDIMQPLLSARWGVRQLVPAGSPGYTRALDAIDQRVIAGQGSAGLSEFLGRMGIRYVLVRNDLQRAGLRGGWPARLHQALDGSPGLRRVARFGDFSVGQEPVDAISSVDQKYPPLEVYEVGGAGGVVSLAQADQALRLYGSPEALLAMADNRALRGRPVLLNDDAEGLAGKPVVADSLRLVRRNFGELHEVSPTLTAGERAQGADVLDDGWSRYATVAAYHGVTEVSASSSAADSDTLAQLHDLGRLPYAAMDGDPRTYWRTGGWTGPVGQWLKVGFERPIEPGAVTVAFAQDPEQTGPPPTRISVETETGRIAQDVQSSPAPQALRVPPGETRWLRIRVLRLAGTVADPAFAPVGIAELSVPGIRAERTYRMPGAQGGAFVLARGPGEAAECMKGSSAWVCAGALARQDEEGNGLDRTFTAARSTGRDGANSISGTATLTDLGLIDRYTRGGGKLKVTAASSRTHPAAQPRAAFDGDRTTTWIAGTDTAPTYRLDWGRPIRLDTVKIARPPAARGALRVKINADGGQTREALLDPDGRLTFAPLTTRSLTFTFTPMAAMAVQITDITVPGVKPFPRVAAEPFSLRCGLGPALELNGVKVPTRVSGTRGDLLAGRPVRFTACGRAEISAGGNRLRSVPGDPYRVGSALVDVGGSLSGGGTQSAGTAAVRTWNSRAREVEVRADQRSFLAVNENFNAGWEARLGDTLLPPVRLDGWKQGWVVPAGTAGTIKLVYRPDRAHKTAVYAGLGLLVVLALAALLPGGPMSSRRRPGPAHLRRGRKRSVWALPGALVLAGVLGFWLGGPIGPAVTVGVALICAWARTRRSWLARCLASPWTIAVVMVAGAASWAAGIRFGTTENPLAPAGLWGDLVPQVLGLVIVGRLAIEIWRTGAAEPVPRRRPDFRWSPPAR